MAKKEKKAKTRASLSVIRIPAENVQHASFSSQSATFAWKLTRWSMLLNIVLIAFICVAFICGVMKTTTYVAASSNINLTRLEPL